MMRKSNSNCSEWASERVS